MYFFLSFQAVHVVTSFQSCQFLYNPAGYMFVLLQLVYFVCCFLPLVCYFLPLVSILPPLVPSFLSFSTPSFRLLSSHFVTSVLTFHLVYKPHSLLLPFRFTSYSLFVTVILSLQLFPFIRYTSFLSIQFFPFIHYCLPFVSTLSFHSLLSSFRFTSCLSFVTFFLSFHLWPFIRSGLLCVTVFMSFHL